ncbi:hypothetical protein ABKV19_001063 [Rosa sericea]
MWPPSPRRMRKPFSKFKGESLIPLTPKPQFELGTEDPNLNFNSTSYSASLFGELQGEAFLYEIVATGRNGLIILSVTAELVGWDATLSLKGEQDKQQITQTYHKTWPLPLPLPPRLLRN